MRIVVVAAIANGIQRCDATDIGLNSANAPCVVVVFCNTRTAFIVDADNVTEEILLVQIRIIHAFGIRTCAIQEANGRTRIVIQEYHHVFDVVFDPFFCHDATAIEDILMLDAVYRFARADAFGVVGEGAPITFLSYHIFEGLSREKVPHLR